MHSQPVFAHNPARLNGTADHLFATGLCLPSGSAMTDHDLERVVGAVRGALTKQRSLATVSADATRTSPFPGMTRS
jgi:dTDP-4-amino-4,6-dideoxygalactose transaminase